MPRGYKKIKSITNLPTRIVTLYTESSPESICPHCGAEGSRIHYFLCDDGNVYGAMSGCIQLFPYKESYMSKMADISFKKQHDIELINKNNPSSIHRKLASWYQVTIDTLNNVANHTITLDNAKIIIEKEYWKRYCWLQKNVFNNK